MCKNKLQSQVIDLLRFPMAVAVVVSHYGMNLAVDAGGIIKFGNNISVYTSYIVPR